MSELNASKDVACPLLFAALTWPLGPRPRGPSLAICDLFARSLGRRASLLQMPAAIVARQESSR